MRLLDPAPPPSVGAELRGHQRGRQVEHAQHRDLPVEQRGAAFWVLALVFAGFTLVLEGPTFPMNRMPLHRCAKPCEGVGDVNAMPLERQGLTTTVATPEIYALGTVTTALPFVVIGVALALILVARRRQDRKGSDAGRGMV